ncbi:MAG: MogA/MoaB family molybdenum cofactor biosynthesis protein [Anaerolineales bacterium]|nr:MogA/MoaB family molybdenum cofactor biosynthesis protein [Anaerolineales bacterium]HJO33004.1 MogA/MoaB family molybdenum cofactor biosynthesis protein [Anaerolineales bacterium]
MNTPEPSGPRVAILTVSDRSASGERDDLSGPVLVAAITEMLGWTCTSAATVPDDHAQIRAQLCRWADREGMQLILTTGGTGFAPRDVTPEATRETIEREAPGLMEAIRAVGQQITSYAMLSRAIAGIREKCLIINLPGNPKAVREALAVLVPVLPHALDVIAGESTPELHAHWPSSA